MKRIIHHWTAGSHKANSVDRKHYHFIFEGDGTEVKGNNSISANKRIVKGKSYAAHTRGLNTGSIGLSLACMRQAKERPLQYGTHPMTETQWNAMCRKSAELCIEYGIAVTRETVLSHAEVEKTLGVKQRNKWDYTVLPFAPNLKGQRACGDRLRADVQSYIDDIQKPPVSNLPTEREEKLAEVVHDAAATDRISTEKIVSTGVTGGGVVQSAREAVESATEAQSLIETIMAVSPWAIIAVIGAYWFYRRYNKQKLAQEALQ